MFKIGDKVKVAVLNYRLEGEIVNIENENAIVKVPVYYGKHNVEYLTVESKVQDLWKIIEDIKDYEKHKGMYNLK
jgi:hypothetical protein